MITYFSSAIRANVYQMLANNTAYDTRPLQYARTLQQSLHDTIGILNTLLGTANLPSTLTDALSTVDDLVTHLEDQYANLTDRIGLVTAAVSEAKSYGITEAPGVKAGSLAITTGASTDTPTPTSAYDSFFGSLTGKSNTYVAQAATQVHALLAYASALIAGSVITTLVATGNPNVISALGVLADPATLTSCLADLNANNLAVIALAMTNVGTLFNDPTMSAELSALTGLEGLMEAITAAQTASGTTTSTSST